MHSCYSDMVLDLQHEARDTSMKFVNLTPHLLVIQRNDGTTMSLSKPEDGTVIPRVSTASREHSVEDGVSLRVTTYGDVDGLPDQEDGVTLIVSGMVLDAARHRGDLAAPGELFRGADGQPIGCIGLRVAPWRPTFR